MYNFLGPPCTVIQDAKSAFSLDESVYCSTATRSQRRRNKSRTAPPPSFVWYTNRAFGHQRRYTKRLIIERRRRRNNGRRCSQLRHRIISIKPRRWLVRAPSRWRPLANTNDVTSHGHELAINKRRKAAPVSPVSKLTSPWGKRWLSW